MRLTFLVQNFSKIIGVGVARNLLQGSGSVRGSVRVDKMEV